MIDRKKFIQYTATVSSGLLASRYIKASPGTSSLYPEVRVPLSQRKFSSPAVEEAIRQFQAGVSNKELAWLFNNCFPNTLDTTVEFAMINGRPDTYVITGDIDAMWLRDSTAQVWPYLSLAKDDKQLHLLIAGVINRQVSNILFDPYANAFYKDRDKVGEWKDDRTAMKPGLHERKWEIDSLCYPVRLSHGYWKTTGDRSIFDTDWKQAAALIVKTFRQQQRKTDQGPYKFERTTSWATDGVPLGGYGYPVKPMGLICSMFRPSDDATIFPYLIPSNYFAVTSLRQIVEIARSIYKDDVLARDAESLAMEVAGALKQYASTQHSVMGRVLAFEVNGWGSVNIMDDANVPSLLSLPYLGAMKATDPLYVQTRKLVLSEYNPFFFRGKAGEGIGGPHAGMDMIWPLSIIMRGLTSSDDKEIQHCIANLQHTHGDTGFMHESFHKDDATRFTRKWFAWANTLFGELLWKTFKEKKRLLV